MGYIAEEEGGFTSTIFRQLFRTHRPFRAVIMDNEGTPILWVSKLISIFSYFFLIISDLNLASAPLSMDKFSDVCSASERRT